MKRYIHFLVFFSLFSCVPHRKLLILQNASSPTSIENKNPNYLIQKSDILSIKVSSIDPQSVEIFNKSVGGSPTSNINEASIYVSGYLVNDSGYVNMPVIGDIKVVDLDIDKIQSNIQKKLAVYFKHVSVDVKLMNFRVTILGEITTPFTFTIYNKQTNIFQMLGMAGGITDFGNKRKVKIIRKNENSSHSEYIDISKSDIINSEYYYVMPNDIIYIEPLKAKAIRVNSSGFQVVLSALTFIIVVLNFLNK